MIINGIKNNTTLWEGKNKGLKREEAPDRVIIGEREINLEMEKILALKAQINKKADELLACYDEKEGKDFEMNKPGVFSFKDLRDPSGDIKQQKGTCVVKNPMTGELVMMSSMKYSIDEKTKSGYVESDFYMPLGNSDVHQLLHTSSTLNYLDNNTVKTENVIEQAIYTEDDPSMAQYQKVPSSQVREGNFQELKDFVAKFSKTGGLIDGYMAEFSA